MSKVGSGSGGKDFTAIVDPTASNVGWPGDKPGRENDALKANHVQCLLCGANVVPAKMAGVKYCPKCGKVLDTTIRKNAKGVLT